MEKKSTSLFGSGLFSIFSYPASKPSCSPLVDNSVKEEERLGYPASRTAIFSTGNSLFNVLPTKPVFNSDSDNKAEPKHILDTSDKNNLAPPLFVSSSLKNKNKQERIFSEPGKPNLTGKITKEKKDKEIIQEANAVPFASKIQDSNNKIDLGIGSKETKMERKETLFGGLNPFGQSINEEANFQSSGTIGSNSIQGNNSIFSPPLRKPEEKRLEFTGKLEKIQSEFQNINCHFPLFEQKANLVGAKLEQYESKNKQLNPFKQENSIFGAPFGKEEEKSPLPSSLLSLKNTRDESIKKLEHFAEITVEKLRQKEVNSKILESYLADLTSNTVEFKHTIRSSNWDILRYKEQIIESINNMNSMFSLADEIEAEIEHQQKSLREFSTTQEENNTTVSSVRSEVSTFLAFLIWKRRPQSGFFFLGLSFPFLFFQ